MKSKPLAVAFQAQSSAEAELVRALLEAEGIYAVVLDRNNPIPVDMTPFDGEFARLGTTVYVSEALVGSAQAVLDSAREAGRLLDESTDVGAPLDESTGDGRGEIQGERDLAT